MNKPPRAPAWRTPQGGRSCLRLGLIFRLPLALYAFCLLVSFKVVWQVGAHGLRKRHRLRDEVLMVARLAIIVRPTVYGRNFARPVAMDMLYRRGPLQRVGFPWVLCRTLAPPDR